MKNFKVLTLAVLAMLSVSNAAHAEVPLLQTTDYVGISFWITSMGMLAATVFFFFERGSVTTAWRLPVTVAGLVTGIAFVNYMYMRGVWVQTADTSTIYRYIGWFITIPLQTVSFYLVLSAIRKVPTTMFWRLLVAALVMLISGYLGETGMLQPFLGFMLWVAAWIYIIFEIFSGQAGQIASRSGNRALVACFGTMRMIVAIGWAIYPLGYLFGYLTGGVDSNALNVIYNLVDFINKIAFGLVIWAAAMSNTSRR